MVATVFQRPEAAGGAAAAAGGDDDDDSAADGDADEDQDLPSGPASTEKHLGKPPKMDRAAKKKQILIRMDEFLASIRDQEDGIFDPRGWQRDRLFIEHFGSTAYGLGTSASDLDLSLLVPNSLLQPWARLHAREILQEVLKAFKKERKHFQVVPIFSARTAIITLRHLKSNVSIDLSIGDQLNPFKTQFMRSALDLDPCLIPLVGAVKKFAKQHSIHDASRGSLSSFGWLILTLVSYQMEHKLGPLTLPAAEQALLDALTPMDTQKRLQLGVLCTPDVVASCPHAHHRAGLMLLRLLAYLGHVLVPELQCDETFDFDAQVMCMGKGGVGRKSDFDFGSAQIVFCIQDPVDLNDTLGRGLQESAVLQIRKACRDAAHALVTSDNPKAAVTALLGKAVAATLAQHVSQRLAKISAAGNKDVVPQPQPVRPILSAFDIL
jgi:hypothetical protein